MKITVKELRSIIHEVIATQEAVPPGKWAANTGEPATPDDLERLGENEDDQDDDQ
jgi:hypothetical protein